MSRPRHRDSGTSPAVVRALDVRSTLMRSVRSSGNRSTELKLIEIFRVLGIRGWRRNVPLIGRPDFVFRKRRMAVFVDGCFWHGCPTCYRRPATNQAYWDDKVARNRSRDLLVGRQLKKMEWMVLRLWEHELKDVGRMGIRLKRLRVQP